MWQRHNAQLANFDVTSLRITATAATQQADVQVICLNRPELKPQAHGRGYQFGSLTRIATTGNVSSCVRMKAKAGKIPRYDDNEPSLQ
jgi:hypothetical protein